MRPLQQEIAFGHTLLATRIKSPVKFVGSSCELLTWQTTSRNTAKELTTTVAFAIKVSFGTPWQNTAVALHSDGHLKKKSNSLLWSYFDVYICLFGSTMLQESRSVAGSLLFFSVCSLEFFWYEVYMVENCLLKGFRGWIWILPHPYGFSLPLPLLGHLEGVGLSRIVLFFFWVRGRAVLRRNAFPHTGMLWCTEAYI